MMKKSYEENAPIPRTEYHTIHCPKCGKVFGADELAFDFGKIIAHALEKTRKQFLGWEDEELFEWDFLENKNLKFYLSSLDIQQMFNIQLDRESDFVLDVSHLKKHILKLFGGSAENGGNTAKKFDELVDGLPNPGGNDRIQDIRLREKVAYLFYNPDSRDSNKREMLRENLNFLKELRKRMDDGIIVRARLKVCKIRDDQAAEILDRLEVTFEDGEIISYGEKICPDCGNGFYREAGKYKEILIGMMGSARVGKTAYLAALVDRISFSNSYISVADRTDRGYKEFEKDILMPYQSMVKIAKTDKEQEEIIPLFSIVIRIGERKYAFIFIDMPGEVWDRENEDNFIANKRKILKYVDVMWMCVAPEQIDPVDHIDIDRGEDRIETNMRKILTNMTGVLRSAGLMYENKLKAALIVTMSDKIGEADLFEPDVDVMEEYMVKTENYLQLDQTLEHSIKVKRFIQQYAGQKVRDNRARLILDSMRDMFSHFSYFAVAAYGDTPEEYGGAEPESRGPQPSLIELPFLWSLGVCGCLTVGEKVCESTEDRKTGGAISRFFRGIFSSGVQDEEDEKENWEELSDKSRLFID